MSWSALLHTWKLLPNVINWIKSLNSAWANGILILLWLLKLFTLSDFLTLDNFKAAWYVYKATIGACRVFWPSYIHLSHRRIHHHIWSFIMVKSNTHSWILVTSCDINRAFNLTCTPTSEMLSKINLDFFRSILIVIVLEYSQHLIFSIGASHEVNYPWIKSASSDSVLNPCETSSVPVDA